MSACWSGSSSSSVALLRTGFLLLALALAGFIVSTGVDRIAALISVTGLYVFEDGAKFFAILSWAAYFIRASARQLLSELGGAHPSTHPRDIERASGHTG